MRVPIEINGKWRDMPQARRLLDLHRERLLSRMPLLAKEFGFKAPGKILLRPLNVRGPFSATAGRYWWKRLSTEIAETLTQNFVVMYIPVRPGQGYPCLFL